MPAAREDLACPGRPSEPISYRADALVHALLIHIQCGNYAAANAEADELVALANEKGALFWKAQGMSKQGCILAVTGKAAEAVQMITSDIAAWWSTGSTAWMPFEHARRCIDEAMTAAETTKERSHEADVHRLACEIALMSPEPDAAKAEACFERALAVARAEQAKSWELRAAMSVPRLWRDQGKRNEARDLLTPVYNWFTEGFDTPDLKEVKALLEILPT